MATMAQIHYIRELYYGQDKNISEIARELRLDWRTVQKYVDMEDFNPPAGNRPQFLSQTGSIQTID